MKHDHIGNLLAVQAMVQAMPEKAFAHNLMDWANDTLQEKGAEACGSVGCFGGWVAVTPFFKKQGVKPCSCCGMPQIKKDGVVTTEGASVAADIFGDSDLFRPRLAGENGTEKAVILARIHRALDQAIEAESK